ncbi:MAG TPA: ATP-binding protein [Kamptonema sp.]|nr:ATP-binding protein [Kamptonema sp.]
MEELILNEGTLLNRMTNRIRQSLELQEILSATVAEMRSFLATDRVKIYRFGEDWTGEVIAESIHEQRLPSLLGLHFPASDIPPHAREMFIKARQRTIVNLATEQMTLSRLDSTNTIDDLTVEDILSTPIEEILQRPVDPCHIEYLTTMGVQSTLAVPIFYQQKLWGLLISHHAEPKDFSKGSLQIVQTIADQVSVAIAQSNLLSQARSKAHQETVINQIATWLHAPMNMEEIMRGVLEKVIAALSASGGRLYLTSTDSTSPTAIYTSGSGPITAPDREPIVLEDRIFWQQLITCKESDNLEVADQQEFSSSLLENPKSITPQSQFPISCPQLQIISDIYQEPQLQPVWEEFRPTRIRGMIVMPLTYRQRCLGCLTIFREEIDTDIIWAGRFDPDERNLLVRNSFEAWREFKRGQIRQWTSEEIEIIQSVGTHLAMALMQNLLYQWEREQRILVEMRNQELNIARTIAEEASRLKSDFLSSTSHELRTPLASTLNYLKLLKEGFYDNPEELKEYIQVAHQSAENLVAILNDILDIAKIEAGRMSVNLELLNLPSLLEEKCKIFSLDSRRKQIEFTVECEVDTVWADEMKLGQILTNLLSNAFKFTSKGKVRLKAICRQDDAGQDTVKEVVVISVSDTGIGIERDRQNRLFEAFVQADGSIKRRYGGTGLGLAISKRLVELMGGEIWMDSAGKGQGTTVTFTLPGEKV